MSKTAVIESLAPDPYRVLVPIPVRLRRAGREWIASWVEANIHMQGGPTQEDAIESLRGLILDYWESFTKDGHRLGPGPAAQLEVMRRHIAPIEEGAA